MESDPNLKQKRGDSLDQNIINKTAINVVIINNDGVVDLIRTTCGNNVVTVQQQKTRVHIHNGL